MRFPLAIVVGLGATTFALAEATTREPVNGAQPPAMSVAALKAQLVELGYDVARLKAEATHYEAYLVERRTGGAVEATYDKTSGVLLGARLARDDHADRAHEGAREPGKSEETNERAGRHDKDRESHARERHGDD
jgi:Peptidase propeptide and YPEB domain